MARSNDVLLIDDFARDDLISTLGTQWHGFSDQVMGGISQETIALTENSGRRCIRLTGDVRLENNGGFIQMALDLAPEGQTLDASAYDGVLLVARGNGETYGVHLRTPDCVRPWQSYRASFVAGPEWQEIRLPFGRFEPHRLTEPLDVRHLRRLGLVAIGRAFDADLAVSVVGLHGPSVRERSPIDGR
ncbi:MAG: CIA30 family protein [Defluviicoccus sp.]